MHALEVVVLPDLMHTKTNVFAGIDPFGCIDHATLGGRNQLTTGQRNRRHPHVVEQFAGLYLPTGFSDVSAYVILLVMLLIRPQGIFATMQQKKV